MQGARWGIIFKQTIQGLHKQPTHFSPSDTSEGISRSPLKDKHDQEFNQELNILDDLII